MFSGPSGLDSPESLWKWTRVTSLAKELDPSRIGAGFSLGFCLKGRLAVCLWVRIRATLESFFISEHPIMF